MPISGRRPFTDETLSGEQDPSGGAQIFWPKFGQRPSGGSATTLSSPRWEKVLLREVERLTELKQGWDSYGAPPIRWDAGLFALIILHNTMLPGTPLPQIVPTSVGGIQLEWHERGVDLELHVTGPYECELWYEDHRAPGSEPLCAEVTNDFSLVQNLIADLTAREASSAHAVGY